MGTIACTAVISCFLYCVNLQPGSTPLAALPQHAALKPPNALPEPLHPGLRHSWQNGLEGEDNSTVMGQGEVCPNAAEISRLQWVTPAARGGNINSQVLARGAILSFTLPATYLAATGNHLRITPDWLQTYSNGVIGKNLYIALRVAKRGDTALGDSYAGRVNIHEVNAFWVRRF